MNKILRHKLGLIDFPHSSHEWSPTTLPCGQYGSALPIGSIPRLIFCWKSWWLKINFGWNFIYLWNSNICSHKNWLCKKRTSVSHGSVESVIVSLDAGLRMDGTPAFDRWDLVVEGIAFFSKHRGIDRAKKPTIKRREIDGESTKNDSQRQSWPITIKRSSRDQTLM